MNTFLFGIETASNQWPDILSQAKLGLLTNQASITKDFQYNWQLIQQHYPGQLVALFSPQHGLWCEEQANMIETAHHIDADLGLPVHSLYSETRTPTHEMLNSIDVLLIDLQDVGTRVYTFIWTMLNVMKACADQSIPVVVFDRPNPIGGVCAEGPLLDSNFESFVGGTTIPMRHGLTMAEMAALFKEEKAIDVDLYVVPCQNWRRDLFWSDLGRQWVPTSPNLPNLHGLFLYPGQVLLEGTNLSEGRGTTTPFEVIGAPFIHPERLKNALQDHRLPGLAYRAIRFVPTFDKWQGKSCGGLALHVTDPKQFNAYQTTLTLLSVIKSLWPNDFQWLSPPYEYETEKMPIDILTGSALTRTLLEEPLTLRPNDLHQLNLLDEKAWWQRVTPFLLY